MKNICVFCGANDDALDEFKHIAEICSEIIFANGCNLVYGGSSKGLMGVISNHAMSLGTKVIGIFPKQIIGKEHINYNVTEIVLVDTMWERKSVMIDISDIFIVLPGGFGTLDELFEVLTIKNLLQLNRKEIIIVNYNGFWDELLAVITKLLDKGFANARYANNYKIVNNINEFANVIKLLCS